MRTWIATAAVLAGWAAVAQTPPGPSSAPATPTSGYAGSEACQMCHPEIFEQMMRSPHANTASNRLLPKGSTMPAGGIVCESCHGPGAKHAESTSKEDIHNPARMRTPASNATCLQCHRDQKTRVGVIHDGHPGETVACAGCHSVHANNGSRLVLTRAPDINAQCAACHTNIWAQFQKPFKHKLPEGAQSCTSCHNPHSRIEAQTQRKAFANEPGCFRCHTEMRGPFVYEHAPLRLEGCTACHEPHGSANPRMLTRHEVRFVCLECHANNPAPALPAAAKNIGGVPPAFHDLRSPRYQNCTVCHVKVHGSFVDRNLER